MSTPDGGEPQARDARPRLGFRVGVTGHRKLDQADPAVLEAAVARVLDEIDLILRQFADEAPARRLYAEGRPILRIVSPLAEGADRLVARLALVRGWRLAAPLPFGRGEYERDFPATVEEFRSLLERAEVDGQVVELDGARAREDEAYLEVGRFVLRHSDLVIALWDGQMASGTGGTSQIVAEAQMLGIPVVHVATAAPQEIRLVGSTPESTPYDATELASILRHSVLPDWPKGKRVRLHAKSAHDYLTREAVRALKIEPDFLYRGPFAARPSMLGRFFPALMEWLGGPVAQTEQVVERPPPAGVDNAVMRAFYLHFQRADALATHYAEVHRSGFMLIYMLGSLSLVSAFTAQFLREAPMGNRWATGAELCALVLIFAIYLVERMRRWRERWLDYRSLAETLREADLLAQLGGVPLTGSLDRAGEMHPEHGWVPWLVASITRSLGVVGARYEREYLEEVRDYATQTRLQDQIDYHGRTAKRNASVSLTLRRMSVALFCLTLVAIFSELCWPEGKHLGLPAWLAGVFPAIAAASFGIRNQAEFEIVVHRSARLRSRLALERDQIAALTGARLTSAHLSRMILRAARTMQTDTAEWAAIFEVKESEVV